MKKNICCCKPVYIELTLQEAIKLCNKNKWPDINI